MINENIQFFKVIMSGYNSIYVANYLNWYLNDSDNPRWTKKRVIVWIYGIVRARKNLNVEVKRYYLKKMKTEYEDTQLLVLLFH